ncbi:hypothetical protein EG328_004302 [Venturia inaequalis]|uniref:RRM domain-containing protein n=1 Tax=Venturia inaequalis TaxID=5025 RepID=A0A8H3YYK5_VENIN|nr:hypothetical protein EG328_004302 [Venturia inaequalis]
MSQSNSIQVSNISVQTSEDELMNFLSFCGKVSEVSFAPATKSATVTFEKNGAVKTALLLDDSQLRESKIHVTQVSSQRSTKEPLLTMAGTTVDDGTSPVPVQNEEHQVQNIPITISPHQDKPFAQHEKPMRRILAEYLAHGYRIADQIIERGIDYDKKEGFTTAFKEGLAGYDKKFAEWDQKHHANDKVRELDEKHHLTRRATETWNGAQSYFERALESETGQKVRKFYEENGKEIKDVHEEARRLASLKEGGAKHHHLHHHLHRYEDVEGTPAQDAGVGQMMREEDRMEKGEECRCDEHNGTEKCPQHGGVALSDPGAAERDTKDVAVDCKCGSDAQHCPCPSGTCRCANCAKNMAALRDPPR